MNATLTKVKSFAVTAGALLALAAGGCASDEHNAAGKVRGDEFPPEGTVRALHRIAEVQSAAGARADATLRPFHFDAGRLNSLGEEKLDLMLKDDDLAEPVVVYLDLPESDDRRPAREQAVMAYLGERGLGDDQVRLKPGTNPDYMSPAIKPAKDDDHGDKTAQAMTLELAPTAVGLDKQ